MENTQKARTGFDRIWRAGVISINGLKAAYQEKAFRQEVMLACILIPLSFFLGTTWAETGLLIISVLMVLVAEIINSAIEAVVDLIGQWHELAGKAKDMGSAAVFVALLATAVIWITALIHRFI